MPRSIAISILLVALFAAVPAAAAEAPTREEYVDRLEAVCKPDAEATQRAMKGARGDINAEEFEVAGKKFAKATSIFGSTVQEISAAPRPPADTSRLRKWFTFLKRQESYMRQITEQLRQGHAIRAQRLTARLINNGGQANNVVLAFGFDYCSFKFSRYG